MFPTLEIWTDDNPDPIVAEVLNVDFMLAQELPGYGPGKEPSDQATRLAIAFYYVEGREPKNIQEVKAWAREHRVRVLVKDATANPTRRAAEPDSS